MSEPIKGAGGKGGGGGARSPIEVPDSLRSTQVARVIDVISEGVIYGFPESGPVNPSYGDPSDPLYEGDLSSKYIYLNDTPMMNEDGSFNFSDISYNLRFGTQDQPHVGGFPGSENVITVGAELKAGSPGPYVRTISDANVDAVIVTMEFPRLTLQSAQGDLTGSYVQLLFEMQPDGEAYQEIAAGGDAKVAGKSVGSYTRSWYIPLTGSAPWNIRVTRVTADSVDVLTNNKSYVQSITEVIETKLRYPNTAYAAIRADAKQFGSIPSRSYLLKGIKIRVPSNYDPDTRVYTGLWDGTFQLAWSNNPAWIWYDLLTTDRYGLGSLIEQEMVDKFTCYEIGKYCDEMVDDGYGGTEPRFTCNLYLMTQEDAYKVLANIASVFRGMTYWSAGAFTLVADQPRDPVAIFTNANVVEPGFEYQGSYRKTRHNAIQVSWNNPQDNYKLDWVYVEDPASISQIGLRSTEISGLGCTSRRQAMFAARAVLFTERYESSVISFTTGMEGASRRPGDIIEIHDNLRGGSELGGRLAAGSTSSTLVLDRPITFSPGAEILIQLSDGFIQSQPLSTGSGTNTVTVSTAFAETPSANTTYIIRNPGVVNLYRVVSVVESKPNEYAISALKHDPDKYAYIEDGISLVDDGPNTNSSNIPTNLIVREDIRTMPTGEIHSVITADWTPVQNAANYPLQWKKDFGNWVEVPLLSTANYEIPEAAVIGSTYTVRVASVVDGRTSRYAYGSIVADGKTEAPADVTGFTAEPGLYSAELSWTANTEPDVVGYEIRYGATWGAATLVVSDYLGTTFTWQKQPADDYDLLIKAKNSSGVYSVTAAAVTLSVSPADDFITPSEKRNWKATYDIIWLEKPDLDAQALAVGVSSVAYDTSITNLDTYLGTLTGAQGWTGGATDDWTSYTDVYYLGDATPPTTGLEFVSMFQAVTVARNALIAAIIAATGDPFNPTDTFRPALMWDFGDGSDGGFTISGGSSADSASPLAKVSRKLTWSSTTMTALSPDFSNYSFTGKETRVVLARVRYNSGTWVGKCHFKGLSPSVTTGTTDKWAQITAPPVGQWTDIAWDMALLEDSSTSYIANTRIDQILLDLVSSAGDVEIDHVSIGTYGAGSKMDRDNALYQGILDALATGNVALLGSTVISNGGNLIPNPKSELTSTTLPAGSYGLVSLDSTGIGYNSSTGCRKVLAGVTSQITARTECKPNEVYYVSAQAKVSGAATASLQVETFDKDGVSQGNVTMAAGYATTSTSYTLIYGQATIPANAVAFCVKLNCTAGTHALFDDLGCLRCADAALLVNGSVTALVIAASAIQTYHLSVGPNYQFTATAGGSPLLMNNDGSFSANTVNGAVENSVDAASYMDALRLYPAARSKTYEANFTSAGGQDRGFLINMSSAFGTVTTGLRILHSGSAITVKPVTGTRTYGATITPTTTPASVPAAGTGKLTAIWSGESGTSATRRLIIKCDGVEVQTYSDAAIAAVSAGDDGQQSGYAGILLGTHATRPGDVKAWGIALGIGSVTIQDGTVTADSLIADFAIVNTIRSSNYVVGNGGASATGFKVSGTAFNVTLKGHASPTSLQAEFGDDVAIAGYRALTLADRAMFAHNRLSNSAFAYSLSPWGTNGTEPPIWSSETKTSGTGSAEQSASGTVLATPVESTGSIIQPFTVPPLEASEVVLLTMQTGRYSSSGANASYDGYVKAYLLNTATGVESLLATYTYTTWTTAEALAWTSRSEDISTEIGTAGGDFVLRIEMYAYAIRTGGAGTKTASIYVDEVSIEI
jgi:predicted phage tail protein